MVYKEHIPPPNILFHIHATQPSKYSCILTRKSSSEQSISEVHQPHLTTTTSSVVQAQFTPTSSHSHRYLIILSISQSVIHPPWRPPQQWHQHQYQRPPAPPHPPTSPSSNTTSPTPKPPSTTPTKQSSPGERDSASALRDGRDSTQREYLQSILGLCARSSVSGSVVLSSRGWRDGGESWRGG